MKKPITSEIANKIYDILVEECGASCHEEGPYSSREDFVNMTVEGRYDEYRFQGNLGFGGKFWNTRHRWYVTCYQENSTPERETMIEAADKRLLELRGTDG